MLSASCISCSSCLAAVSSGDKVVSSVSSVLFTSICCLMEREGN